MSLLLCVVDNDPASTQLVTSTGQPLYVVKTPIVKDGIVRAPLLLSESITARETEAATTIHRIDGVASFSGGHVQTQVGIVEPCSPGTSSITLYSEIMYRMRISDQEPRSFMLSEKEGQGVAKAVAPENSWKFVGPDGREYIWQMLLQSLALMRADESFVPLARYRRAKIGIISRPRKAFLEIMSAGMDLRDMIVVTFVAFMKHRASSRLHQRVDVNELSRSVTK